MYIPYGKQWITEDDIRAVEEVLHSDFITTGPKIKEFEEKVAKYVGAKYAVAVSNGTAALHISCLAAGIKEGDEVIVTPITFAASVNCILYCGGTPVFADIDPETYNIDPEDVERKITEKTKAIIPVHFTGQPCEMNKIHEIARKHHLIVIEDAAHALGAEYQGKKIGGLSDFTTFSFHPVKHITTGEGGMVTTNDKELYQKLLLYRSHGITRDEQFLEENQGDWYYEQLELGFNYRITDIQCALGITQLKRLDYFLEMRRKIAAKYNQALKDLQGVKIPFQKEGCNNSWHLYVLQILEKDRREVFDKLRKKGIGVNVHYIPVYHHPYYQKNGYKNIHCPNAEKLYENIISIPMYPGLKEEEQEYVIQAICDIVKE